MFENYTQIFQRRGADYHQAMHRFPMARAQEFEQVLNLADLRDNFIVGDIPSGGCYIHRFLHHSIQLQSVETSPGFAGSADAGDRQTSILCQDISQIPLPTASLDRLISLAGLHHLQNRATVYREFYRLLKPGGILCLGDGFVNSMVAKFLNIFVDRHSEMGHQGEFLDQSDLRSLTQVGFEIIVSEPVRYTWQFDTASDMVQFCQLLFGIDQASPEQILGGIEQYLGYQTTPDTCVMNWELFFVKAIAPATHSNRYDERYTP